jgi:hypothetical protein
MAIAGLVPATLIMGHGRGLLSSPVKPRASELRLSVVIGSRHAPSLAEEQEHTVARAIAEQMRLLGAHG